VLHERLFDLDLRVALTGIEVLEDLVPLPHFYRLSSDDSDASVNKSGSSKVYTIPRRDDHAYHFIAVITLSRLMRRVDDFIHGRELAANESEPM
jgi:hypothetical protein